MDRSKYYIIYFIDALTVMIEIGKKYPTNRLWLASHLVINISRPKDIEVYYYSCYYLTN